LADVADASKQVRFGVASGSAVASAVGLGAASFPFVSPEAYDLKFRLPIEQPDQLFLRAVASAVSILRFHRSLT